MSIEKNSQLVTEFYAALNSNQLEKFKQLIHPEILNVEPQGFPTSGTYRGYDQFVSHVKTTRATWAEGACNLTKLEPLNDYIIAHIFVHVRLKENNKLAEGNVTDVFGFKDGKISEMRSYLTENEAREWIKSNS